MNTKTKYGFSKKELSGWLRQGASLIETQGEVLRHTYSEASSLTGRRLFCAVGALREVNGDKRNTDVAACHYLSGLADFNDSARSTQEVANRMRADARAFEHGKVFA